MKEYEAKLKEYEALAGNTDAESRVRKDELIAWFKANNTDEFKEAANNMVTANLDRIDYFGKTRAGPA